MKKNIFLFAAFFLCLSINGQSKTLIIKVSDAHNNPVAGAIILFDNVKQNRLTNSYGVFKTKITIAPKEISAFHSKIGIKKVKYHGAKKVFIQIQTEGNAVTATSKNQKGKDIGSTQFYSIYDYLRGRFPGVNVTFDNTITIRGYNSVNGSVTPLFIVDGTNVHQDTFGTISPSQIKSLTVLKGPETAAYGVRGANGVIIVKTMM